jgi:hypothetical protein
MENIDTFILPDIKKPEKPKKEPKMVPNARDRLTRSNREVPCAYCSEIKILNPDQYQLLFDTHGSDEKIKDEYMCKPCDMKAKNNPVEFWLRHGEQLHVLAKDLKEVYDLFNASFKTQQDLVALNNIVRDKLSVLKISNFSILISRDNTARGIQLREFPFVGTINVKIYEDRKTRIEIIR